MTNEQFLLSSQIFMILYGQHEAWPEISEEIVCISITHLARKGTDESKKTTSRECETLRKQILQFFQ